MTVTPGATSDRCHDDASPPPWWVRFPALLAGPLIALAVVTLLGPGGEDAPPPDAVALGRDGAL
ncbi:MAG: hypothetical protein ACO3Y3_08370, partial [Phycisphaerales bacterium]